MMFDQGALRARLAGRSYWRLRYVDGTVVNEWDVDWSLAPKQGRQSLRLYCPNGQTVELGNNKDATGRLFQLKVGIMQMGGRNFTAAHLIGIVEGYNGECRYAAWDYTLGRITHGRDNVNDMYYQNIGRLSFDVLGLTAA